MGLSVRTGICAPARKSIFALGTAGTLAVFEPDSQEIVNEAAKVIAETDASLSSAIKGSDVSLINRNAGKGLLNINSSTYFILKKALMTSELTGGAFDITQKPAIDLWNAAFANGTVPIDSELDRAAMAAGGLYLSKGSLSAGLKAAGQAIDLGGIIKGAAAANAARLMSKNGVGRAVIDIDGNIAVLGCRPNGSSWEVGLQNPDRERGSFYGTLKLKDSAAATAGLKNEIIGGIKYSCILNPQTGRPVCNGLLSVTAVCESAVDADALSTAFYVMGLDDGMELARSLDGVEAVFVTENGRVYCTGGIVGSLRVIDSSFRLMAA